MTDFKKDVAQMQSLVNSAFISTGALAALTDGSSTSPEKLQKQLETTASELEYAALKLRVLCEKHCPGLGGYGRRPILKAVETSGYAELSEWGWLQITVYTLLPHCRFQPPTWLSDTIGRILDEYEAQGMRLPFFERAMLVIEEQSDIDGRHIFDQDNKGWKAVSNALKGRLFPDDDQYTLDVSLLSVRSNSNLCKITILDREYASDFFSVFTGNLFFGGY